MYNVNIVNQTRRTKDSAKKQEYRQKAFGKLPRVEFSDLTNGLFAIRFWPVDPKNPHGYLDYRAHDVPQDYLIEGLDPRIVEMQCPRSSNWDPMPCDEEGNFQHRCLPCELEEYVYSTFEDDPTMCMMDLLPEGLKEIFAKMDWKRHWKSKISIPCTIKAVLHTKTPREGNNGKTYYDSTWRPGGPEDFLSCELEMRQPDFSTRLNEETGVEERVRNGYPELLFDLISKIPDIGDLQTGRWISVSKSNDGKGSGGYSISADPYPSHFPADKLEYSKLYAYPNRGDKTQKRATSRIPFAQQLAIFQNAAWAQDLRSEGVPISDEDADMIEAGYDLVSNGPITGNIPGHDPFAVAPPPGYPPVTPGFTPPF